MLSGAQLWLLHSLVDEDAMEAVLTQLKAAGYTCVETMYGKPLQHRAVLDRIGLRCYATHIALSAMPPGAEVADFAHRLGAETICVSGLLRWQERAADDYRRGAEALNAWGARFHQERLALHYHNHDFEFAAVEATLTGMEILLSQLDPALVSLCFDGGWAVRAGQDPLEFATKNGSRIKTLHVRDFRGTQSVPLGAGDMDLSHIIPRLVALPH